MSGSWSIMDLKRCGIKQPWPSLMCYLGIGMKGFRKITENVSQDR